MIDFLKDLEPLWYSIAGMAVFCAGMAWHSIMVGHLMPPEREGTPPYLERSENVILYHFDTSVRKEYDVDQRIDNCGALLAHSAQEARDMVLRWLPRHFMSSGIGWAPARPYQPEAFEVRLKAFKESQIVEFSRMDGWDWKAEHKRRNPEPERVVLEAGDTVRVTQDTPHHTKGELLVVSGWSSDALETLGSTQIQALPEGYNHMTRPSRQRYIEMAHVELVKKHEYNETTTEE
jgi:hypothetical protein